MRQVLAHVALVDRFVLEVVDERSHLAPLHHARQVDELERLGVHASSPLVTCTIDIDISACVVWRRAVATTRLMRTAGASAGVPRVGEVEHQIAARHHVRRHEVLAIAIVGLTQRALELLARAMLLARWRLSDSVCRSMRMLFASLLLCDAELPLADAVVVVGQEEKVEVLAAAAAVGVRMLECIWLIVVDELLMGDELGALEKLAVLLDHAHVQRERLVVDAHACRHATHSQLAQVDAAYLDRLNATAEHYSQAFTTTQAKKWLKICANNFIFDFFLVFCFAK